MASGVYGDPFGDLSDIMSSVSYLKVVNLKAIIKDINANSQLCSRPRSAVNKKELINSIDTLLRSFRAGGEATKYAILREIVARNYAAAYGSRPSFSRVAPSNLNVVNANGHNHNYSSGSYGSASNVVPPNKYANPAPVGGYPGGSSSLNSTYNSRALPPSSIGSSSSARPHFKSSPFFTIKEWMAGPVWLSEVPKHQRASNFALFAIRPNQKALLLASSPKPHEIRLFGCNKASYDAALNPHHPAHIDFPMSCDAKVNGVTLTASLRGSKKAAGRVPPPNLNKDKALFFDGRQNRVDMVCTDTSVKYAFLVALCEVVRSDTLVSELREKRFTSKAQIVVGMRAAAEDDEIQAGDATLSLKCPLSYMRIKTPCRSTACTHVQCFDALSFYSVNEQTPSWSCPVCAKPLKPDELFWDGYVQDILDQVPDSEDSVLVDPMGKWRTPNGKFTSEGQASAPANGAQGVHRSSDTESDGERGSSPVDRKPRISNGDREAASASAGASSKPPPIAVELLDSPSPPNTSAPLPPRSAAAPSIATAGEPPSSPMPGAVSSGAVTPRSASGRTPAARPRQPAVIDLTLSDDDDDDYIPVSEPSATQLPPRPFIASVRNGSSSSLGGAPHSHNGSAAWPPGMATSSSRVDSATAAGPGPSSLGSAGAVNGSSASNSFTTAQTRRRRLSSSGEDETDESSDRIQGPGKRFRPASELFSARRLADDEFETDSGDGSRGANGPGAGSNGPSGRGVNGGWGSSSVSAGNRAGGSFSAAFMRSAGSGPEGGASAARGASAASGSTLPGSHEAPFRNGAGASRAFRWGPTSDSPTADRSSSLSSAGGASGLNDSPVAPSTTLPATGHANGAGERQSTTSGGFQGSSALFRDEDEDFEEAMARDEELRRVRDVNGDLDGWGLMEQATAREGEENDDSVGGSGGKNYFDSPV